MGIESTYRSLAQKTIEKCSLRPAIANFIRKRDQVLGRKEKTFRLFVSKYAVALVINEFDEGVERERLSND